jgi:hypothetical protein
LAKTEQRAVIGIDSVAERASRSASSIERPKRPAILTIVSPVPDEHLSFSRNCTRPSASRANTA